MAASLNEIDDWMRTAIINPSEGPQIQTEDQDVYSDLQPTKDYRMMIEQHLNPDFEEGRKKLQLEETLGMVTTQSCRSGVGPLSTMSETHKVEDLLLSQTIGLGGLQCSTENPTINWSTTASMSPSSPIMTISGSGGMRSKEVHTLTEEGTTINGVRMAPSQQCLNVDQVSFEECDATDQFITSLMEPFKPQPTNSDTQVVTLVNVAYQGTLTDDGSGAAIPTRIPVGKKRNCQEMSNSEDNTSEDGLPLYKCKPFKNDKKKERQRKNALRAHERRTKQQDEIATLRNQVTSLQNQLQVKNSGADLVTKLQNQLQEKGQVIAQKDQVIALLNVKVADLEKALQAKEDSIEVRRAKLVELAQLY